MSGPFLLVLRVLLILALYLFLAWGFYVIWQDLRRQARLEPASTPVPLTLILQANGKTQTYRFTHPEVIIGRDPAADCHLMDRTISAQHTRLHYHHNQWWVEDLHSTNGTFLNQVPVTEPLVITSGDELRCGQVLFRLRLGEAEPEADEIQA